VKNVDIGVTEFDKLVQFALENKINLVVPGPEVPLVAGVETHFRKGISSYICFLMSSGHTLLRANSKSRKTGRIKGLLKRFYGAAQYPNSKVTSILPIPCRRLTKNFSSYEDALAYVEEIDYNIVIKADGLAAGKGVVLPTTKKEAKQTLKEIMQDKIFGSSGKSPQSCLLMSGDKVVIEEFLEGDEISILAFSDGYTIVPLPTAQDHKRIFDGDKGPNTGGMGCYAPAPIATPQILAEIQQTVLQKTIDGARKDGIPSCSDLTDCRIPVRRSIVHRTHADSQWAKGIGVQRALRRSRM
jgi:phosphoribosylamine--glycine ligase / phosphoribosylformylglycinamidine cyclo-ligase